MPANPLSIASPVTRVRDYEQIPSTAKRLSTVGGVFGQIDTEKLGGDDYATTVHYTVPADLPDEDFVNIAVRKFEEELHSTVREHRVGQQ